MRKQIQFTLSAVSVFLCGCSPDPGGGITLVTTPPSAPAPSGAPSSPSAPTPIAPSAPPQTPFGSQIRFFEQDRIPRFGIQYAFEARAMWSITFTVNGRQLANGQPIRNVAWRLWDLGSQTALTDWKDGDAGGGDSTVAWAWSIDDRESVRKAVNSHRSLLLQLAVNHASQPVVSTHFVQIGSYCQTNPDHFLSLTTSRTGCDAKVALDRPIQPTLKLPRTGKTLQCDQVRKDADAYCAGVTDLLHQSEAKKFTGDLTARIKQEANLARKICRPNQTFSGYEDISDANVRSLVDVEAAKDALWKLRKLSADAGRSDVVLQMIQRRIDTDVILFCGQDAYRDIYGAYSGTSSFMDDRLAIAAWARGLNEYNRNL